jgi:hypothetical protein
MDVTMFSATWIATLVITKAFEKTGEVLGEKALEQGGKLMQLLKRKSPDTARAIEVAAQNPKLPEQQQDNYEILVERVKLAAKADPEIAVAVQALADVVKSQQPIIQKNINIAENNRGNVAPGGNISVNHQYNNF